MLPKLGWAPAMSVPVVNLWLYLQVIITHGLCHLMGYTHDTQENLDMVCWFHIDFFDLLELMLLFIVLLFIMQLWCHLFYFTAIWKCNVLMTSLRCLVLWILKRPLTSSPLPSFWLWVNFSFPFEQQRTISNHVLPETIIITFMSWWATFLIGQWWI